MKKQAVLVMLIEQPGRSVIRGKMSNKIEANKIRNLLYEMSKKDKTIINRNRSTAKPMWVLTKNNTGLDKD